MGISIRAIRRRYKLLALAITAAPVFICSTASADRYWKDSVTANTWSAANDWSATSSSGSDNAGAPGSSDTAYILNTTKSSYTVTLDVTDAIDWLEIGDTGGGTDTLSQTTAFNLTANSEFVGTPGPGLNRVGFGVHTQSAGTNTYSSTLEVGDISVGTYNLSGTGSIAITGAGAPTMYVGNGGSGNFNQSGGTVTLNGGTSAYLNVGSSNGTGTYNLSGAGSLSLVSAGALNVGAGSTFNQTRGQRNTRHHN